MAWLRLASGLPRRMKTGQVLRAATLSKGHTFSKMFQRLRQPVSSINLRVVTYLCKLRHTPFVRQYALQLYEVVVAGFDQFIYWLHAFLLLQGVSLSSYTTINRVSDYVHRVPSLFVAVSWTNRGRAANCARPSMGSPLFTWYNSSSISAQKD